MKYNFDEKEYTTPVCKVYSVMVESVIANSGEPGDDLGGGEEHEL